MNNIIISPCHYQGYKYDIYDDTLVIYKPIDNIVDIYKIENNKWIKKNEFITNVYNDPLFDTYLTKESLKQKNLIYCITINSKYIYISFIYFIQVYELINNEYIHIKTIDNIDISVKNNEIINDNEIMFIKNDYTYINNNNILIYGNYNYYLTILPDYTTIFTKNKGIKHFLSELVVGIDDNNLLYTINEDYIIYIKKLNNENNMWITYKEINFLNQLSIKEKEYLDIIPRDIPYHNYSITKNGKYVSILFTSRIKNEEITDYDDFYYYINILIYEKNNEEEYNIVFNYKIPGHTYRDGITINNNILTFYRYDTRTIYFFMKINDKWLLTNKIDNIRYYIDYFDQLKSNDKSINMITVCQDNEIKLLYTII